MPVINPYAVSRAMPAYAAVGTRATPGTTSVGIPYPSGISAGDTLIAIVRADHTANDVAVSPPAGFSLIAGVDWGTLSGYFAAYIKTADGTESGNATFGDGGSGNSFMTGIMYRFTGGSSVESASAVVTTGSATGMSAVTPLTSTVDNALAVQLFHWTTGSFTCGAITGATGGTYTEQNENNAANPGFNINTAPLTVAGSITGGSATLSSSSGNRARIGFILKP